jgi:phage-related protein
MAIRELQYIISAKDNVSRVFGDVGIALGAIGITSEKVSKAMVGAGVVAVAFGAVMAKAFMGAVSAAAEFETGLHEVWTLMDTGKGSLDAMQQGLFDLSAEVPQTLGQLTEGLYWITSAGYRGADAMNILSAAAKLAVSTLSETGVTTDILIKTLDAFTLKASEAGRVADIMFTTVKLGVTRMSELAGPWGAIIGMASMAGIKVQELGAAFATMTRMGLATNLAGTAIRGFINGVIGPSEYLTQVWGGLTDKTIQATLAQEGMTGIISRLGDYLGITSEEVQQLVLAENSDVEISDELAMKKGKVSEELKKLFPNLRGMVGVMALLADGGANWSSVLDQVWNSMGANEKAFGKMMDTFQNKWALAKNAFDRLKITIGQGVLPVMSALADGVTKIGNALNKLPQGVKSFIGAFLGIGAIVLLITGLIILFSAVGSIASVAFMTVLPYVAALAGAIIGLSLLVSYLKAHWKFIGPVVQKWWGEIHPILTAAWNRIKEIAKVIEIDFKRAWHAIAPVAVSALKLIWRGLVELWQAAVSVWNHIKGPLASVFKELWSLGKEIYSMLKEMWPALKIIGEIILGLVIGAFVALVAALRVVGWILGNIVLPAVRIAIWVFKEIATVTRFVYTVMKMVWNAVAAVFSWVWNLIVSIWQSIGLPVVHAIEKAWHVVRAVWSAIWSAIISVLRAVWLVLVALFTVIIQPLIAIAVAIWNKVHIVWSFIWNIIVRVVSDAWKILVNAFNLIMIPLVLIAKLIWDVVKGAWEIIWMLIKGVLTAVWDILVAIWNAVIMPLVRIAESVWNTVSNAWSIIWGAIQKVVEAVWNFVCRLWDDTVGKLGPLAESVWHGVAAAWDATWGAVWRTVSRIWNDIKWLYDHTIGLIAGSHTNPGATGGPGDYTGAPGQAHSGGKITPYGVFHGGGEIGIVAEYGEYMIQKNSANKLGKGILDMINATGRIPTAMVPVPTGGGGQTFNIQSLTVYGIANADEMFDEINKKVNRSNIRSRAGKEVW